MLSPRQSIRRERKDERVVIVSLSPGVLVESKISVSDRSLEDEHGWVCVATNDIHTEGIKSKVAVWIACSGTPSVILTSEKSIPQIWNERKS